MISPALQPGRTMPAPGVEAEVPPRTSPPRQRLKPSPRREKYLAATSASA